MDKVKQDERDWDKLICNMMESPFQKLDLSREELYSVRDREPGHSDKQHQQQNRE